MLVYPSRNSFEFSAYKLIESVSSIPPSKISNFVQDVQDQTCRGCNKRDCRLDVGDTLD